MCPADRHGQAGEESPDVCALDWRKLLDEMRTTRRKQFLRVARKMLNHLCSIGLPEAQAILAEVDAGGSLDASREGNMPEARRSLEASALMSGAPFELAAQYLGDEEILARVLKWQTEDKGAFLQHRGGRFPLDHARDRPGHQALRTTCCAGAAAWPFPPCAACACP